MRKRIIPTPRHSPLQAPLADDWTDIPFGSMYARCAGLHFPGIPVVLVHGLVISSSYMVPLAQVLGCFCPVYAVDLPGFGRSSKPPKALSFPELAESLELWLSAKGLQRVHLLGNSMGCQVIAEYALRYPARIDRIVLEGPTVDRHARAFWPQVWRQFQNTTYDRAGLGPRIARDLIATGLVRALATTWEVLRDRIEDKLPRLGMPVLVVRGEKDAICPARWAEEVVRLLPHAEFKVIPRGPHSLNYSMPLELFRVMRPFLGI